MHNTLSVTVDGNTASFMALTCLFIGFVAGVRFMTWGDRKTEKEMKEAEMAKVVNLDEYEDFDPAPYEWRKENAN